MEIDLETINDRECMQHALIGLITNLTTSSTDRHTRYFFKTALDGWSSWLNSTRFEDNSERIAYAERAIEIINMNATAEAERLLATCREIIRDSKQKACVSGAVAYAEQLAADARLLNQINRDHEYRAVLHKLIDFNLENNL